MKNDSHFLPSPVREPIGHSPLTAVAVIGAGTIGSSIVADLILHGIRAIAVDVSKAALRSAQTTVVQSVKAAALFRKEAPKLKADEILARVRFTTELEAAAESEFVIENVTEDWETKKLVYQQLDRIVPEEICFGANTSCLSITRIGSITRRAGKVVGMHFMNPAYLVSTVEVIQGEHTAPETIQVVEGLFGQLDKEAIIVKDSPGFVSNRLSHLFMNEAAFVFQEGVATARQIDAIFKKCFGHKMGPLETADLIGLDTVVHSLDVLYDSFHDPKFRCCTLLRKMVDAGYHGRKSGRGFYDYGGTASQNTIQ